MISTKVQEQRASFYQDLETETYQEKLPRSEPPRTEKTRARFSGRERMQMQREREQEQSISKVSWFPGTNSRPLPQHNYEQCPPS